MIITVSLPNSVSLSESSDSKRLHVVSHLGAAQTTECLQHVGASIDGDHAWISSDWLRSAGPSNDDDWLAQFESMLRFASSQGWLEQETGRIGAHIEWCGNA